MDVTASEPSVSYDERTGWTAWIVFAAVTDVQLGWAGGRVVSV